MFDSFKIVKLIIYLNYNEDDVTLYTTNILIKLIN